MQEALKRQEYWRLKDTKGRPPGRALCAAARYACMAWCQQQGLPCRAHRSVLHAGVLGWWPERAITFLENHDTGSTQNHWPFPGTGTCPGRAASLQRAVQPTQPRLQRTASRRGMRTFCCTPGCPWCSTTTCACAAWRVGWPSRRGWHDHTPCRYSDGLLRPSLWRRLKSLVAKSPRLDGRAFTLLPLDRCIVALIALRKRHGIASSSKARGRRAALQHCPRAVA